MKNAFLKFSLILGITGFLFPLSSAYAQPARSFYFMDNAPVRLNLNPALQPMRGYFNIPLIGAIGATAVTDPLSVDNFIDILDEGTDFLHNEKLFNKLKKNNEISMDLNTDIISFGFYSGKGFWTVNLGTKILVSASIPKTMFEFARDADRSDITKLPNANYEVKDLRLNADVLAEIGLGYSRPVNDRLTIGGRFKFLVGIANLDAHVDKMSIKAAPNRYAWQVETRGRMDISMKGLELGMNPDQGYIDDIDFDSPGLGGMGMGIDLGASYNLVGNLVLSAAVNDLGFVKWSGSATTTATANSSHNYDANNLEGGSTIFNFDLIQFEEEDKQEKRTTSLRPVVNVGAEYTFCQKKIGIGILSSTRFQQPENFSELTLSANYHPRNWFGATVSYSFLHSDFKTFGFGLKFGPLFLATDYMITGDFKSVNRANAYLGISIPMGKSKRITSQKTTTEKE